jgi:hypothetical protein
VSLLGASSIAVAAFNLVCTGTGVTGLFQPGSVQIQQKKEEPFTAILRVDLDSKRWCSGECETTQPIFSVEPTRIIFRKDSDSDLQADTITFANRESGYYFDRNRVGQFLSMNIGSCEKAPFSGFPERKF